MKNFGEASIEPSGRRPASPAAIASWYTDGVSDGLGDRLLMFDNTAAASLELLRFRPELVAVDGFEQALRESVRRLAAFQHPAFSQALTVQRLDDDRLALVSTHTAGRRISGVFERPQPERGMHPGFAAWLISQLTPALVALHAQGVGIAHGVLTSDRIVLTQEGQFVVVEFVLGAAVDQLLFTAERLWREVGIVAIPSAGGPPRLDAPGDIVQLALIALSIVIGRRVTPEEYPEKLAQLLDEFSTTGTRRSPSLTPPLRRWLERALQTDGGGFGSAKEAEESLRDVRALSSAPSFEHLRPAVLPSMSVRASDQDLLPAKSGSLQEEAGEPALEEVPGLAVAARPWRFESLRTAVALAALVFVQTIVVAWLLTARFLSGTAGIPVTLESEGSSGPVTVDGRQAGLPPLQLNIDGSVRSIRLPSPVQPAIADTPNTPPPAANAATPADTALTAAATRQRSGGVRLSSPIELQVLLDQRVMGSSADGPVFALAGRHELELVNRGLGYRSTQIVEVVAGRISLLTVTPPDGRVSINALPWAQVLIDGKLAGETPLANVPVPIGEHTITFRHPQLGERSETTLVRADTPTRISVSFVP